MAQFQITVAGATAQVESLFESTKDYCRNYLSDGAPDFSVTVTREDLAFEQRALDNEAREEGLRRRVFSDPFLERAAIQRQFTRHLLAKNTLLLHGSAVAMDGRGYLFTASCGTGKSTHTRLWLQRFGSRAVMINDDKPFLRLMPEGVLICGSPWSGKHGLDSNISVPLQGICLLNRGLENRIRRISPEEALPMLLHQSHVPSDPEGQLHSELLVKALCCSVPLWQLECTRDVQAAEVAWQAMAGGR